MIFAWDDTNIEHLAKHNVSPAEAREVVEDARSPFPMEIGDGKLLVWGSTVDGRYLQVIYVLKTPDEVEYESLTTEDWLDIESSKDAEIVRIIHAMDLTPKMKQQLRKRRK